MKKMNLPPGPRAKFPLGHLFSIRKDIIEFLTRISHEYGDVVSFSVGPIHVVLLNHPDYIKEVLSTNHQNFVKGRPLEFAKKILGEGLLTSEGEYHARQSRMVQPAFHHNRIAGYASDMTACAVRLMERWQDGMTVDIAEEMTKLGTAVAGKTMFGADVEGEAPGIVRALLAVSKLFGRVAIPYSELLLKLPLPSTFTFYRSKALLDDTIRRMIAARRKGGEDRGDLLSLLLQARDGEGNGAGMTDQQVRDEAITLFLTSFDTTSVALAWTWYLLSQNPGAEADLYEEVDRVLQGRLPASGDVQHLHFIRMVFAETLRLFPPSYVIARQAREDFSVGGYDVARGTLVLMSPYLMHHDARFHPDPETFNPRALASRLHGQIPKYAYFPFGGGPRACIGEEFAWMESAIVIASLAQSWHMPLVPSHPVERFPLINLKPRYGIAVTLQRRKG